MSEAMTAERLAEIKHRCIDYGCVSHGPYVAESQPDGCIVLDALSMAVASCETDEDGEWFAASFQDIPALVAEVERLQAQLAAATTAASEGVKEIARLRDALLAVEWIDHQGELKCPWCDSYKYFDGHADDCPRQQALGITEAEG